MNGVIVIRKEAGMTSFDVVRQVRRILGEKKAGHGGTLDPNAEGVLPVFLGSATKLCDFLSSDRKTYIAELTLGMSSDTEDIWGEITERAEVNCTPEEVRACMLSFVGPYDQIPPMYSAKKIGGEKLYTLARQHIEIERKAVPLHIYELEILKLELPRVLFRVECEKGTYIRTLCADIGRKLGLPALMSSLLRTKHGRFGIEDAVTLEELRALQEAGEAEKRLLPPEQVLDEYPAARIRPEAEKALRNGNKLPEEDLLPGDFRTSDLIRVFDQEGCFKALYGALDEEGLRRPVKMFL